MKSIRAHKDLDVWQVSMALVKDIYCITKNFPSDERFGLILQLRRAVVSIPSNIAEGASRQSSGTAGLNDHFLPILIDYTTHMNINRVR
ncbi:MAG: four helix bundle protein [Bacteroidota bacterium]